MAKQKLKPAQLLLARFGRVGMGPRALGREIGVDHSRLIRWPRARADQGTDGLVPQRHQEVVLHVAKKHGVRLTAEELILGGYL